LVDHLVAPTGADQDRSLQVGDEVLERLGRPDRDVYVYVGAELRAQPLGVLVGDLDLELREELVRVGHGQRERRVLQRLQPQKRRVGVASEQRITRAAQPDQTVGELDDRPRVDLYAPEARALDRQRHRLSLVGISCSGNQAVRTERYWHRPSERRYTPPARWRS